MSPSIQPPNLLPDRSNSNKVTKRFWLCIKSKQHLESAPSPIKESKTDSKDKAYAMADYFSSFFTSNNTTLFSEVNDTPLPGIAPITVHVEGVTQLLANIQPHIASEPDNLPVLRKLLVCTNSCIPSITRSRSLTNYLGELLLLFLHLKK